MARRTGLKSSEEVEWKEREPKPIPVTVRRQSSTFKRFALANVRITCIVKLACNSKIMIVVVGTFILLLFNERKTSKAILFPLFQFPLLYFPQIEFPTL